MQVCVIRVFLRECVSSDGDVVLISTQDLVQEKSYDPGRICNEQSCSKVKLNVKLTEVYN